jgi:hypothetical protein
MTTTRLKRRMTAIEFEAVRPLVNISEERSKQARAALVDGLTLASIAEAYDTSRQNVNDVVRIVWQGFERYQESQRANSNAAGTLILPPGWEQVTLIAPSHLIKKFRAEIADASAGTTTVKPKARRKNKADSGSADASAEESSQ